MGIETLAQRTSGVPARAVVPGFRAFAALAQGFTPVTASCGGANSFGTGSTWGVVFPVSRQCGMGFARLVLRDTQHGRSMNEEIAE